ncbi:MAG: class I SAM-dependent methyltransferase [Desulfamplus sp.]|nr:class I SAM-dependent methyltransferase [Desulfamplus sp.]
MNIKRYLGYMIDFEFSRTIKGFMADTEAMRLYEVAFQASKIGPCLEIGSYCGKSAYFIGSACKQNNGILYSIDHHRGSEEQQLGEEYFDPELYDDELKRVNTSKFFINTLEKAKLLESVVPIISSSAVVGKMWLTPLSMLFIDGGHTFEAAMNDYAIWANHIMPGGFLVIHDIFIDPSKGGQAPRQVYEKALESGLYNPLEMTETLGVLQKK